jgi:hypothetical protein
LLDPSNFAFFSYICQMLLHKTFAPSLGPRILSTSGFGSATSLRSRLAIRECARTSLRLLSLRQQSARLFPVRRSLLAVRSPREPCSCRPLCCSLHSLLCK